MIAQILKYLREKPRDYTAAKAQSEMIDRLLGLNTAAVEDEIRLYQEFPASAEVQAWVGLPVQSMLTPYSEFVEMIECLAPRPGDLWVDLGAGYGRLGFVLEALAPGVRFLGYELVPERVEAGVHALKRAQCLNAELLTQDLADPEFKIPSAQVYFIYDFGTQSAIKKVLADLRAIARSQSLVVIARGRASRHCIERGEPWLAEVVEPEHSEHYSIYRSA